MKKNLAILLLAALPSIAMADPRGERGSTDPQAEQDRRRQMRTVLGEIKAQYPNKFEYLMKLREENPMGFRQAMGDILRQKKMGHFKTPDPEIMAEKQRFKELKDDFHAALEDHNSATDAEKAKHRKELLEMAEEIFEAKQNLRRLRVKKIRDELKNLEDEISERDENREELIEAFMAEKLGESLKGL